MSLAIFLWPILVLSGQSFNDSGLPVSIKIGQKPDKAIFFVPFWTTVRVLSGKLFVQKISGSSLSFSLFLSRSFLFLSCSFLFLSRSCTWVPQYGLVWCICGQHPYSLYTLSLILSLHETCTPLKQRSLVESLRTNETLSFRIHARANETLSLRINTCK
jgi:hypothetical protein